MPASHEDIIIISHHYHHYRKYYYCILNINYTSKNKYNKYVNYFQFCNLMLATHICIIIIIIIIIINNNRIIDNNKNIFWTTIQNNLTYPISITSSNPLGQQFFHLRQITTLGCIEQ